MSPSCHIRRRVRNGARRYYVEYRLGGRVTQKRHAGSFRKLELARERQHQVASELAAGRDPKMTVLAKPEDDQRVTLQESADRWRASRHDVAASTAAWHKRSIRHATDRFGDREPESLAPAEIAAWVAELAERLKPATVGKALNALAQVLDHHGVYPNPARDPRVKKPRDERPEIEPPTADEIERVLGGMAARYVLPVLILDATGMRVGELESMTWGDLDSGERRWRIARQRSKTRRGRWVKLPGDLFESIDALVPREDRVLDERIMPWLAQANLRRDIARACKASGVALWSPHGLRHRRISLWHRDGHSWAQIGVWAGQRNLSTTADLYTHLLPDREIDRAKFRQAAPSWGAGGGRTPFEGIETP